MTWVKLEDGFPESPKVIGLSDRAFRVHVRGLCYCSAHLTDGVVPLAKVREWGTKTVDELEAAGLWMPGPTGYAIHDFLDYNPSAESVKNERRKARERRAKGGKRSGDVRANVMNPDPTRPVPEQQKQGQHLAPRPRDALFEVVAEVCGIDWNELTQTSRGALNKAVAQLRPLHPDPADVRLRASNWPYDIPLTPNALAKHWPALSKTHVPAAKNDTVSRALALAAEMEAHETA